LVKKPKQKNSNDNTDKIKNIILKNFAYFKKGHLEKLMALEILEWAVFNSIIRILNLCP